MTAVANTGMFSSGGGGDRTDEFAVKYPAQELCPGTLVEDAKIYAFDDWSDFVIMAEKDVLRIQNEKLVEKIMEKCIPLKSLEELGRLQPGMPCTAPMTDEHGLAWNRGIVRSMSRGVVSIYFIDTGDNQDIDDRTMIKPLPQELADFGPGKAICCRLSQEQLAENPSTDTQNIGNTNYLLMEKGEDDVWTVEAAFPQTLNDASNSPTCTKNQFVQEPIPQYVPLPHDEEFAPQRLAQANPVRRNDEIASSSHNSWTQPQNNFATFSGKEGKKGPVNRKVRILYEPCKVSEVYPEALKLEIEAFSNDADGGLFASSVLFRTRFFGGSLRVNDLRRIVEKGDRFLVLAHRQIENNPDNPDDSILGDWEAKDLKMPIRSGCDFVTHAVVLSRSATTATLYSRIHNINISAGVDAFYFPNATGTTVNLQDELLVHRTVLVRCSGKGRSMEGDDSGRLVYDASAVEFLEPLEQDEGVLYRVTDSYVTILRDRTDPNEEIPCRYIFAPVHMIEAEGLPQHDWFGRAVAFSACEDQPTKEDEDSMIGGSVKWKACTVRIMTNRPRGKYSHPGIWRPRPDSFMEVGGRGRGQRNGDDELSAPEETVEEFRMAMEASRRLAEEGGGNR